MRPAGDIYLDLEKLYDELVDDHGMQMGDLIYWLHGHLKIHRPDCIEEYISDGSNPILRYGPKPNRRALKKELLKELKTWESSMMEPRTVNAILKIIDKENK